MTVSKSNTAHRNTTKTFHEACLERNRFDLLERWDYSLNKDPKCVAYHSKKVVYLKCPLGKHESEGYQPEHIFNDDHFISNNQPCKKCNSFAQFGIDTLGSDFLSTYWDYEKNQYDPWVLQKKSNKKVWIKCAEVDYHPSYDITCADFTDGNRCPYCKGFKVVPEDSLGAMCTEVINLWSEKNSISAFELMPSSHRRVWLKCESGKHQDYCRPVSDSRRYEFRCPECAKNMALSSYQKKTADELGKYGYTVLHEEDCPLHPINSITGRKMKYDNIVTDIKLVVEVHGAQHYRKNTRFFASMSEEEKERKFQDSRRRDKEKKEYAIVNGYTYLELPYKSFDDGSYVRRIMYAISAAQKAVSA